MDKLTLRSRLNRRGRSLAAWIARVVGHRFFPVLSVLRLHLNALLYGADQRRLAVALVQLGQYPLLVRLVLVPARVDLGNQVVKVRVWPERPLRDELLPAGRTLLVARAEGCDDALVAESVQTFLGGHCVLQHVQADGAHELAVQAPRRHGDHRVVDHRLLRRPVQLVQRQLPGLVGARRVCADRHRHRL